MSNLILIFSIVFFNLYSNAQSDYKLMMNDNTYNFYEVVEEAETYFKNHSKGKGLGWKPYQRWKFLNECKYHPSGNRSQTDPYFVENSHQNFVRDNAQNRDFYNGGWSDLELYSISNITNHYPVY